MEHDQQNFLSFWTVFCPFTPLAENQNFDKAKKTPGDNNFTHVYHKFQSYDVWLPRYVVQQTEFFVIFCHFGPFFALLPF